MIGFDGYSAPKFLKRYKVAGVILFSKNIKNPKQLKKLTRDLKKMQSDILIAVDQEGGMVERLKQKDGFLHTTSAQYIKNPYQEYSKMAKMLRENGINLNLAPVVDLRVNPSNPIIAKLKRSYSKDPNIVLQKSSIFISAMSKEGILTSIKHFPGHGSSKNDSHKGFTDISTTWSEVELLPFYKHIQNSSAKMVMSGHLFNRYLDQSYPASLSYNINQKLLRDKMGFDGVIISDDLQMKAISDNYTFKKALELSINSGVDILLISNFLDKPIKLQEIVHTIHNLILDDRVSINRIKESIKRIDKIRPN
jgi:beta-N-acetylhexosaminidase